MLTIFAGNAQNCYRKLKNLYGKIMNLSGNMKEFIWKKYGKVKNLYRNVKDLYIYMEQWWILLNKRKNLYGKNMEKWNICMETWNIYKEKWRISMEKWQIRLEKWKKYMTQRYSKYRFFDVNCILSILFQVQLWGCPGKPKFQFHILCVWSILYIYIGNNNPNWPSYFSEVWLNHQPDNIMCVCKYNICIFIISHKVLGTTPPFQSPTSSSVRSTFLLVDLWIISETMCLLVTNPSNLCSKHSLFNLNFGLLQEGLSGNRVPLNSLVHHPFPIIKWHWKWGVYMYIRYIYIYIDIYIDIYTIYLIFRHTWKFSVIFVGS